MELIGKPPIHPVLFYSGKVCGYLIWGLSIADALQLIALPIHSITIHKYFAGFLFITGGVLFTISMINLGKSTRLGLPTGDIIFKIKGIYRLSRNPMYLGFDCFTLAAILYTLNTAVILMGIYSLVIYHLIILGEEKFLAHRFGVNYFEYKKKVRRYL